MVLISTKLTLFSRVDQSGRQNLLLLAHAHMKLCECGLMYNYYYSIIIFTLQFSSLPFSKIKLQQFILCGLVYYYTVLYLLFSLCMFMRARFAARGQIYTVRKYHNSAYMKA